MEKDRIKKRNNFKIEELPFGRKRIFLNTFKKECEKEATKNNSKTSDSDNNKLLTLIDNENPNKIEYSLGNYKAKISYIIDASKKLNIININDNETKFSDGFYNFEYKKTNKGLKELIYINKRREDYIFKYNVKVNNLRIEKKNNHIVFKSNDLDETIFILLAPFLYDSSRNFSHKVNVDIKNISDDEYELVYTFDEKWINSDDRNLPIVIDPTISVNEESSEIYQLFLNDSTGEWEEDLNQTSYFYVDFYYSVGIYIDISQLNLNSKKIASAYLNLDLSNAGNYLVNDETEYLDYETSIDVTEMVKNGQVIDLIIGYTGSSSIVELSQNRDILVINYEESNNIIKSIPLSEKFVSLNYVKSGENKIAFNDIVFDDGNFNFDISHIFDNESQYSFGNGFKLNLNTSITKKNNYYEYCDEVGTYHLLFKKYFININSQKEEVNESEVEVDDNLNLITKKNGKTYDVSFEYCSFEGLRLISNIDGIKNIDYLEQRTDDQINLENEIKAQEDYFSNLVFINRLNESYESSNYGFLKPTNLNATISYIEDNYKKTTVLFFDNVQISSGEEWHNLENQKKNAFGSNSSYKMSTLFKVLKKYKENLVNLKSLYLKTPISFLIIKDKFYGFNKYGQLCQIFDKYENYININREEINSFYGKKTVITSIGNNIRFITFGYNFYNQLIELNDSYGTIIKYDYDGTNSTSKLIRITDNKSNLSIFNYSNNNVISSIKNNDGNLLKINYNLNKLSSIYFYNYFSLIDKNTSRLEQNETENLTESNSTLSKTIEFISSTKNISESSGNTKIYNSYKIISDGYFEQYLLGPRDGEFAVFKGYDNQVDEIEINKIVYGNYKISVKPIKIINSNQNFIDSKITSNLGYFRAVLQNISSDFSYNDAIFELEHLDSFNRVIKKETNRSLLNQANGVNSYLSNIVEYIYSFSLGIDKIIELRESTYFSSDRNIENSEKQTILTEYEYDGNNLIKSETYNVNTYEEEGKNIVEYEYDEKGNLLNKCEYNTLCATSKFYEEKEYDDRHRVINEFDELGLNKIRNKYKNNRLISISNESYSIIGYAYDERDNLISLNRSTLKGKPNQTNIKYNLDYLTEAKNGNIKVDYEYDFKGRISKISLNNIDHIYEFKGRSYENSINQQADLNNVYQEREIKGNIIFDKYYDLRSGAIRQINENNIKIQKYDYNSKDLLVTSHDYIREIIKDYNYDILNRLVSVSSRVNSSMTINENYTYNNDGLLETKSLTQGLNQVYSYHYLNHDKLERINLPNGYDFYLKTDKNNRYIGNKIEFNNSLKFDSNILYLSQGDHTSILPSTHTFNIYDNNGKMIESNEDNYIYDENKLINEIYKNHNLKNRFKYDALGRLIREDNVEFNKTYQYFYDNEGNILESKVFDLIFDNHLINEISSNKYIYQNGKLIKFNDYEISYDDRGNPLTYKGNILKWRNKSLLSRYGNYAFSYDAEGRRVAKGTLLNPNNYNLDNLSVSESELNNATNFIYDNEGNLVKQTNGNNIFEFMYDSTGLFGFKFNGTNYFYKKNLLNDIEEIINLSTNEVVAKYIYDAWGNHKVVDDEGNILIDLNHIGNLNPFRYRSYYYDVETGLYWLNTRYYDPEIKRFVSIDSTDYLKSDLINGLNLYVYCANDPVNMWDPTGCLSILLLGILLAIGSFIVGFTSSSISQGVNYGWDKINYWQSFVDGLFSAGSTVLSFTGIGVIGSISAGALLSFSQYVIDSSFHNESISLEGSIFSIALGAISGAFSGKGAKNMRNIADKMKLSKTGERAISAITKAANRYVKNEISHKGFQAVINRYGRIAFKEVSSAIIPTVKKLMIAGTGKNIALTIASTILSFFLIN